MNKQDFEKLVVWSQESLRRFLVAHCCGDIQLADDIAQEAYLKAFLSIQQLKDPSKFKKWLYRIAYTTFLNHHRSNVRLSSLSEVTLSPSSLKTDSQFEYQDLHSALSCLSPETRNTILLFYMEGYSTSEIANIMELKEGTVRQHLSRGRKRLKDLLSSKN